MTLVVNDTDGLQHPPSLHNRQHLVSAPPSGADDEDVPKLGLVLLVPLCQCLQIGEAGRLVRDRITHAQLAAPPACPRTMSVCSDAPAAAACSPLLMSAKAPNFLRRPSRSPILGWAAKASSQPVTGVCRGISGVLHADALCFDIR